MFLNGFAEPFVLLCNTMPPLNDVVEAYESERLKVLDPFKAICESWLREHRRQSGIQDQ